MNFLTGGKARSGRSPKMSCRAPGRRTRRVVLAGRRSARSSTTGRQVACHRGRGRLVRRSTLAFISNGAGGIVSAGAGDDGAMAARGRGEMRASHADREGVIAILKVAYVDGLVTKDEFDERVGQTLVSRTNAELALITNGGAQPTRPESALRAPSWPRRPSAARDATWVQAQEPAPEPAIVLGVQADRALWLSCWLPGRAGGRAPYLPDCDAVPGDRLAQRDQPAALRASPVPCARTGHRCRRASAASAARRSQSTSLWPPHHQAGHPEADGNPGRS